MTDTVISQAQKLDQDAIVSLCTIDASELGGGVFTFTNAQNGTLLHDGVSYVPIDFAIDGLEIRPDSEPATPTVKLKNVNNFVRAFVTLFSDGRGALFTRIRTYRRFLDDGENPDPSQIFPPEIFWIERKSGDDPVAGFIEWELSSILDQEGAMFPIRQVLRGYCDYSYRRYVDGAFVAGECPYAQSSYFTRTGDVTVDPAQDVCGKRLSDCKKRFGQGAVLPYRGFPGAGRIR